MSSSNMLLFIISFNLPSEAIFIKVKKLELEFMVVKPQYIYGRYKF